MSWVVAESRPGRKARWGRVGQGGAGAVSHTAELPRCAALCCTVNGARGWLVRCELSWAVPNAGWSANNEATKTQLAHPPVEISSANSTCMGPTCGGRPEQGGATGEHRRNGSRRAAAGNQAQQLCSCRTLLPSMLCKTCAALPHAHQHLSRSHALLLPAADAAQHGIAHLQGREERWCKGIFQQWSVKALHAEAAGKPAHEPAQPASASLTGCPTSVSQQTPNCPQSC